uniref:CCHC-type domain-containing protein n=1 Tax=Acrobeloides nanus TaxID=290746 RepID=A0A914C1N8_9BILA
MMKILYNDRISVSLNDRDLGIAIFDCSVRFIISQEEILNFYCLEFIRESDEKLKGFCMYAKVAANDFKRLSVYNRIPISRYDDLGSLLVGFANQLDQNPATFIQCNGHGKSGIVNFHGIDWNLTMIFQRLANLDIVGYLTEIIHEQRRDNFFLHTEVETLKEHLRQVEHRNKDSETNFGQSIHSKETLAKEADENLTKEVIAEEPSVKDVLTDVKANLNEEFSLNTTELDEDKVQIVAEPKMKVINTLTEVLIDEKKESHVLTFDELKKIEPEETSTPLDIDTSSVKSLEQDNEDKLLSRIRKLEAELNNKCCPPNETVDQQFPEDTDTQKVESFHENTHKGGDRGNHVNNAEFRFGFCGFDFDDERKPRGFGGEARSPRSGGFSGYERRGPGFGNREQGFSNEGRRGNGFFNDDRRGQGYRSTDNRTAEQISNRHYGRDRTERREFGVERGFNTSGRRNDRYERGVYGSERNETSQRRGFSGRKSNEDDELDCKIQGHTILKLKETECDGDNIDGTW